MMWVCEVCGKHVGAIPEAAVSAAVEAMDSVWRSDATRNQDALDNALARAALNAAAPYMAPRIWAHLRAQD